MAMPVMCLVGGTTTHAGHRCDTADQIIHIKYSGCKHTSSGISANLFLEGQIPLTKMQILKIQQKNILKYQQTPL